jgi:RNA polymerase sigma factor (sigma-70 family)
LNEYLDILHNTAFFDSQEKNSAQNLLAYILEKEKESTQQIAVMYFVNGMTIKEIAETKNLSVSGVHKHLDKLRRKIREKGEIR